MTGREPSAREALFWEPAPDRDPKAVRCTLCAHRCLIREGQRGVCRVRENQAGRLVPLAWGRLIAMNPDPIEKKPLSHFQPGTLSLSIASAGCNLQCAWCQNHDIAQMLRGPDPTPPIPGRLVEPEEVVRAARAEGCASISYTYTEPTIHYEYARQVGVIARAQGLKNVFVTNGTLGPEALRDAARSFLDAANIDLKAMSDRTYRELCKAGPRGFQSVLESIEILHAEGVWVEVTTLVIPHVNDSDDELRQAARFLAGISPDIPWHLSRYHPDHKWLSSAPTPIETLRRARDIGLEAGLRYVYTGNVWGDPGEHTYCPSCGRIVIERRGFRARPLGMKGDGSGRCADCGAVIAGVEMP